MPKPKSFKVETALDEAMELYRERGYADTSVQDVAKRLNLTRSSIYGTFGNKRRLYEQTLRRYGPARVRGLSELRWKGSPREALVRLFELLVVAGRDRKQWRNCLLIDTALELGPRCDPEVRRLVEEGILDLEDRIREAIELGRGRAEIAVCVEPEQTARALVSLYLGLYVLVRSGITGEPILSAALPLVQAQLPAPAERSPAED